MATRRLDTKRITSPLARIVNAETGAPIMTISGTFEPGKPVPEPETIEVQHLEWPSDGSWRPAPGLPPELEAEAIEAAEYCSREEGDR